MNLYSKLQQRAAAGRPVRVGLIGAGKFGSTYLAQIPRTPGVHLVGIADLSPDGARANLARVGWSAERMQAVSLDEVLDLLAGVQLPTRLDDAPWVGQQLFDHPADLVPLGTGTSRACFAMPPRSGAFAQPLAKLPHRWQAQLTTA